MSDLISRQSVYDMLNGLGGCDAGDEWAKGWDEAIDTAISELDDIPAICRWTPISEKWPDKNGYYLVTYHEWTDGNYLPKYDDTYVRILRYNKAIFRLPVCCDMEAENDTHREVLAWCELPEPYEGVSE